MPSPILAKELQAALRTAFDEATRLRHEYVTLEHLLLALLRDPRAGKAIRACGANVPRLRKELEAFLTESLPPVPEGVDVSPQTTVSVERVLQRAAIHVMSSDQQLIDGGSVLVQMFKEEQSHAVFLLKNEGLTSFELKQYLSHGTVPDDDDDDDDEEDGPGELGMEADDDEDDDDEEGEEAEARDPLKAYTVDLHAEAEAGRIDPLIGRDRRARAHGARSCARRRKNNPVFVGESGVGKTAIAEGLALAHPAGQGPRDAQGRAASTPLDMGALARWHQVPRAVRAAPQGRDEAAQGAAQRDPLHRRDPHDRRRRAQLQGGSMDASQPAQAGASRSGADHAASGRPRFAEYKGSFDRDRALVAALPEDRRGRALRVRRPCRSSRA